VKGLLGDRRLALGVIFASLALLAYVVFGSSDEDKILLRIKELASAVETRPDETNVVLRIGRINGVFKEGLEPDVTFSAPELGQRAGIRDLAVLAGEALQVFGEFKLAVGATDVQVDGAVAHAESQMILTGARGSELHGDRRSVRFELRRSGGEWRVTRIDVGAKSLEQPEARP
jgi:hypothetical protein